MQIRREDGLDFREVKATTGQMGVHACNFHRHTTLRRSYIDDSAVAVPRKNPRQRLAANNVVKTPSSTG